MRKKGIGLLTFIFKRNIYFHLKCEEVNFWAAMCGFRGLLAAGLRSDIFDMSSLILEMNACCVILMFTASSDSCRRHPIEVIKLRKTSRFVFVFVKHDFRSKRLFICLKSSTCSRKIPCGKMMLPTKYLPPQRYQKNIFSTV